MTKGVIPARETRSESVPHTSYYYDSTAEYTPSVSFLHRDATLLNSLGVTSTVQRSLEQDRCTSSAAATPTVSPLTKISQYPGPTPLGGEKPNSDYNITGTRW